MKRLTTVILAILVLAGLSAAILLSTPAGPVSPVPARFLEFSVSEVKALDIRNPEGEVRLERDGEDRERWRVRIGKIPVRASAESVGEILNNLSRVAPKNFWRKEEIKPDERRSWGLDKPPVQVTLELEGRTVKAAFGGRTLERQNVYAEKDGNGDAYVVPVSAVERLESAKVGTLRERRPAGFEAFQAKSLGLSRADGTSFEAVKSAGGGTWDVTSPYRGPADPQGINDLLAKALNVEVSDFVVDGAPDLGTYGLLQPRATITVRREGREKPLVLKLGGDAGSDKVWFMEEGENSVYTCGAELPNAVARFDPAALRDRNLLRIGWAKVDSIEFAHADPARAWKLLRVLDRWDVEKPERTPAETTLVDGLLDEIRKAEVMRFLDGEDPAKHGLAAAADAPARLVLVGVDEAGSRTLLLGKRDAEGRVPARVLPLKGEAEAPPPVLLDGAFLDRLEQGWLAWREREVLKIDLGEVRGMARRTATGTETFLRDGKSNAWTAAPGGPEPDGGALSAALAHLLSVHASAFEAKTKEGLEKWGLGDPPAGLAVTITLQKGDGEKRERTLVLGAEAEGGGSRYARMADMDLVFRLPNQMVNGADVVPFWSLLSSSWAKPAPAEEKAAPAEEKPAPPEK